MKPEQLFHQLLGLGTEWRVAECLFDKDAGVVTIWVEETPALWEAERGRAGGAVQCYDHTEEVVWRHLNVFEHRCNIHCRVPRGRRVGDGKVYRLDVPWEGLSKHFTAAFEAMALMMIREMPVKAVADMVGETDTRLWRMLKRHVGVAHAKADWSETWSLGMDEMSIRKGHSYLTVFCDMVKRKVLFACPGKDHSSVDRFVEELIAHKGDPSWINLVSMDMSPAYVKGVRENFGRETVITFDKFHVVALVNEAVDQVRKLEAATQTAGKAKALKGQRWLLLKNPENLTGLQTRSYRNLLRRRLACVKAHQARLALQDIYQIEERETAERKLRAWCRWVRWLGGKYANDLFKPMLRVAKTILKGIEGILGYWKKRTTNAYLEAVNSVFSAVKRRARGFRSVDNLLAMLYFTAGDLKIPATH
jgi:transposase